MTAASRSLATAPLRGALRKRLAHLLHHQWGHDQPAQRVGSARGFRGCPGDGLEGLKWLEQPTLLLQRVAADAPARLSLSSADARAFGRRARGGRGRSEAACLSL